MATSEPAESAGYTEAAAAWSVSHGGSRCHAPAMTEADAMAVTAAKARVAELRAELAATRRMTHLQTAAAGGTAAPQEWEGWVLPPGDAEKLTAAEDEARRCQTDRRAGCPHYFGLKWTDWAGFADVQLNNVGPPEEISNACPRNTKRLEVEALGMVAAALGTSFPEVVEGYL